MTSTRTDSTMRVVPGSSSSFLCPPGHPMLTHHIESGPRPGTQRYDTHGPNLIAGLDYAVSNQYGDVPDRVRAEVEALYAAATPVRSELWERGVYGYFRGCYSPDGTDRNVSRLCTKCGVALQYEAKVDAFAEAITAVTDCPQGGTHA